MDADSWIGLGAAAIALVHCYGRLLPLWLPLLLDGDGREGQAGPAPGRNVSTSVVALQIGANAAALIEPTQHNNTSITRQTTGPRWARDTSRLGGRDCFGPGAALRQRRLHRDSVRELLANVGAGTKQPDSPTTASSPLPAEKRTNSEDLSPVQAVMAVAPTVQAPLTSSAIVGAEMSVEQTQTLGYDETNVVESPRAARKAAMRRKFAVLKASLPSPSPSPRRQNATAAPAADVHTRSDQDDSSSESQRSPQATACSNTPPRHHKPHSSQNVPPMTGRARRMGQIMEQLHEAEAMLRALRPKRTEHVRQARKLHEAVHTLRQELQVHKANSCSIGLNGYQSDIQRIVKDMRSTFESIRMLMVELAGQPLAEPAVSEAHMCAEHQNNRQPLQPHNDSKPDSTTSKCQSTSSIFTPRPPLASVDNFQAQTNGLRTNSNVISSANEMSRHSQCYSKEDSDKENAPFKLLSKSSSRQQPNEQCWDEVLQDIQKSAHRPLRPPTHKHLPSPPVSALATALGRIAKLTHSQPDSEDSMGEWTGRSRMSATKASDY